ncbi:MAG: tRNA pseudouridine(38-40) synthase TruA [Acidimicrobiales bacterium]
MRLFDLVPEPGAGAGVGRPGRDAGLGDGSPDLVPEPEKTTRLRLVVAYDGTGFRGFAAQAGQRTVAGELAAAIATVARHQVELTCAGRTDAGVHALGQVVHLDVRADQDLDRLVKGVNAMLAPAVVVRRATLAGPRFDARRSAVARHYRYLVLQAATADPLLAAQSWHVRDDLDMRSMASGADALLGEHDFRAFCRRAPGTSSSDAINRRVLDTRWAEVTPRPDGLAPTERLLRFDIAAQSFCHQMVRSIVGALVDVGRGRRRASDVVWMLRSGDRSHGTTVAPAHGLCLVAVDYDDGA